MIRFQTPEFPPLEELAPYFEMAQRDRWFSNSGPCHHLLTERLERFVGRDARCLLVSNGTIGLMVALRALTVDRPTTAREVLVPSFTFVASINAIVWAGLTPVFVDVDAEHWHPSADAIEQALEARGDRVAAVLGCSTFGTPPPIAVRSRWERACRAAGVPLLVDSAAAFGARDELGEPLGLQGDVELFSFHATKPFAIGEGGMLVTRDESLYRSMAKLTNFGIDANRVLTDEIGLNGKLSELHAAAGLAVLDRFAAILDARRSRAVVIRDALARRGGFSFQGGCDRSTWQFVPALAESPELRAEVLREAERRDVEIRRYFTPCHHFEPCASFERIGSLEVTDSLTERTLSLPLANDLSEDEIGQVIECCIAAVPGDHPVVSR